MKSQDVALASNYLIMRKQATTILAELDKGIEMSPHEACDMFPWKDCWIGLRPLVEARIRECDAELQKLGIE